MASNRYFLGQGKLYLAKRDVTGNPLGFRYLGNCPNINLSPGTQMRRYALDLSTGGEIPPFIEGGSTPEINIDLENVQKENLAIFLYAGVSTATGGAVTDENITAHVNCFVPFANINVSSITSIRHISGSPTYVSGTDYIPELLTGGITIPQTGSAIAENQVLRASYSYTSYDKMGAFTTAAAFYWLRYNGIDTSSSFKPFVVDFFKVRLMASSNFNLLADNLGTLGFRVTVHKDDLRAGTVDEGKIFRVRRA
jgi:hypothetical protein